MRAARFSLKKNSVVFCKSILGEENPLLLQPSLDKVKTSCELIVDSWENRKFVGAIKGDV